MANIDQPVGLAPVKYMNGAAWNQQANLYRIPSTDTNQYGVGDIVLSLAGADANGVPDVVKAAATSVPRGVIVGIEPILNAGTSLQGTSLTLETIAIPATKTRDYYVRVVDDPKVIFEAQVNNTSTLVAADTIGKNCKPVIANPASGSPFSGSELDSTSFATTSTHMLKVLGMVRRTGVDLTANSKLLVMFNVHELNGSTAGV